MIGGGQIKTRFGYQKVSKEDFGLTDEDILLMDDHALNQLVSIKHYRPFRHLSSEDAEKLADAERSASKSDKKKLSFKEKSVNVHRVIAMKKQFKQQVSDRLQMLGKLEQAELEQEKSKYLKKDKKKKKEEKAAKKAHSSHLKKRKHKEIDKSGGDDEDD